jgi:uncharacterized membrane protein
MKNYNNKPKRNYLYLFFLKFLNIFKLIAYLFRKVFGRFKLYFINGLIITLPLVITIFISKEIFLVIDDLLGRYIYGEVIFGVKISNIYGIGFIIICSIILLIGALAKIWFGQKLIYFTEKTLLKTPYVKNIFLGLKQLSEMLFKNNKMLFEKVILVEYPRKGIYTIGFLTYDASLSIIEKTNKPTLKAVFVPTTPNPTSGFLIMVEEKDIIFLDMSVEEAMKLIISGGILVPENAN